MKILVIDVGGTNVKVCVTGRKEPVKIPSGPAMTAARMAAAVRKATEGWTYEAVSIGYPGPVKNGKPAEEPPNLARGWVRFDYRKAFGCPVRIVNDAAMQALGSYRKGRMLFLGLGTGLGSALVADGEIQPLELAHLPYRHGQCYEDYAGLRGYKRLGRKRWTRHVEKIVALLKRGLQADEVVLGGGQMKKLNRLPPGSRPGNNQNAILGGYRLWSDARRLRPARRPAPNLLRPADTEPPAPPPPDSSRALGSCGFRVRRSRWSATVESAQARRPLRHQAGRLRRRARRPRAATAGRRHRPRHRHGPSQRRQPRRSGGLPAEGDQVHGQGGKLGIPIPSELDR